VEAGPVTQDAAWAAWLAGMGAAMAVCGWLFWRLERPGLTHGKGGLTLSWTLRRWLGLAPERPRRVVLVPLFVAVVAMAAAGLHLLIVHIVLE